MRSFDAARVDRTDISSSSDTRVSRTVRVRIKGYMFMTSDDYVPPDMPEETELAVVRVDAYGDPNHRLVPQLFIDCNSPMTERLSKAIAEAIPLAWAEWEKAFGSP